MATPKPDPDVSDEIIWSEDITRYDEEHFITYLRLLDAEAADADWRDVARIVLHRDPDGESARTRRCWEAHLARARWMASKGYRKLLERAAAEQTGSRGHARH